MVVKNSTAQLSSTPECTASVCKNHDTIYAAPKSGEGGANRVAVEVPFTCTSSHYSMLLDDWKWDPGLRQACHHLEPVRKGDGERIHGVGHEYSSDGQIVQTAEVYQVRWDGRALGRPAPLPFALHHPRSHPHPRSPASPMLSCLTHALLPHLRSPASRCLVQQ